MAETEEKEQPQVKTEETPVKTEMRLEMRLDADRYQRIKKLARYAAVEKIIPDDHRGNITDWVNYCLNIGEDQLTLYAHTKRGF